MLAGLEEFARAELRERLGTRLKLLGPAQPGHLQFQSRIGTRELLSLGTLTSLYRVERFEVPRPRALLGEEHLHTLVTQLRAIVALHPPGHCQTFRFSAAGATSGIFERLAAELERRTGLRHDPVEGDLVLRVRRAASPVPPAPSSEEEAPAFEVLLRLTPRPLSARAWRVCNLPGALNATVARVMAELTPPAVYDRFLNLACGSGTLMVERLQVGKARQVLGVDIDPRALACAARNLEAAGIAGRACLLRADAGRLPLADGSVNVLCADLPYGMLMGSGAENERLYPALLGEAARVAAPGAAMALITQAVQVLRRALQPHRARWSLERSFQVQIPYRSGLMTPTVLLLRRTRER